MPEVKLRATLDSTSVTSSLWELRSQLGMALANATGFNNAAMSMAGAPSLGGSGFGMTHTNQAMAYTPHYGAVQAHTTLQQEWQVGRYGLEAAQQLKPPGVSAASYAMGAMSNAIERDIEGRQQAQMAGRAAFFTGVGGLAAGEAASMAAAPVGAFLGGKLGGRFFGAGGVGAGRLIGGLAAAWTAFDWANDYVGGKISEHFAQVEQIGGVTQELGQLAGGGRGLSRLQQYNLGVSARQAAGDLNMDVQQMGDILALGRQAGMLPTASDPGKAREQFRDFARTIEEGAQVLQSSLAGATQVIKTAVQQGMSAQEGIARAAGAGGADVWLAQQARMRAFAGAGAAVGMSMGFAPGQGSAMFTGSLGAGAQAGLSADEMKIMGGRFGAAQFVGTTQMAMAASPLGNLQLMAAQTGRDLSGAGMMGVAGAAMEAMSEGGDFLSNMGRFMVHQNEYRRGIGARGIRTMAREQIRMGGELISEFMPDLSQNEAQRMYAISMGLNPDQAKTLVGGGAGGGGGGGGRGAMGADEQARAVIAMQNQRLSSMGVTARSAEELMAGNQRRGFGAGYAVEGAMTGAMMGSGLFSVPGAIIGGIGGFIAGNLGAIGDMLGGGPPTFASAEEKADYYRRQAAAEYDKRMSAAKEKIGYQEIDQDVTANFLRKDLSGTRLSYDATGRGGYTISGMKVTARAHERNIQATAGGLKAMGLEAVDAGPGTIEVGGEYYKISDVQRVANSPLWTKEATESQKQKAKDLAFEVAYSKEGRSRFAAASSQGRLKQAAAEQGIAPEDFLAWADKVAPGTNVRNPLDYERWSIGANWQDLLDKNTSRPGGIAEAANQLATTTKKFISLIPEEEERNKMMAAFSTQGGLANPMVREFMSGIAGKELRGLDAAYLATVAGGVAGKNALETTRDREVNYLADVYGGEVDQSTRAHALDLFIGTRRYRTGTKALQRENLVPLQYARGMLTDKGMEALARATPSQGLLESAKESGMGTSGLFLPGVIREGMTEEQAAANLKQMLGKRTGPEFNDWLKSQGYGAGLAADDVKKQYYQRLTTNPKYIEAKAAAAKGDAKLAQQYMDQAQRNVIVEGAETFKGFTFGTIDVTKPMETSDYKAVKRTMESTDSFLAAFKSIPYVGNVTESMRQFTGKEMQQKVLQKYSFMEMAKAEMGPGKVGQLRKRKRGAGTLQRAAGFGARESAMDSINRSLRHSERMLKDTGRAMATLAREIDSMKNGKAG
jgi:hypothetical protein